jgi:hypothetical protein
MALIVVLTFDGIIRLDFAVLMNFVAYILYSNILGTYYGMCTICWLCD